MNYAIIQLQGKQYRVAEGDTIIVDRVSDEARDKDTLTVNEVLLVRNELGATVGAPFVSGASVALKVLEDGKGEKIRVFKFKAKSRYRRTQGHRQYQTTLQVTAITA